MFIPILLSFIFIILVYTYYVHYERKIRLIDLIPGPPGYPIVGNIFPGVHGTREKLWNQLLSASNQYYPIFKLKTFFISNVFIRHPDDIETILSSTKHIEKSWLYDGMQFFFGTGLITSKGAKWHSRRKLLNPAFHFNILQQFVKILIKEAENMTNSLKNDGDSTVVKDLIPFINEHTLNAICETIMGISTEGFEGFEVSHQQYSEALERGIKLVVYKMCRPWLNFKWIFSLMSKSREQSNILKILLGFTEQIIAKRKLYHERTHGRDLKNFDNDISAEEEDAEPIETQKKHLVLLDLLIAASREGLMTDLDIREEVNTFVTAGHETMTKAVSFILALLAEHKHIQDRVRNEVDIAIQENDEKFTMNLLQQLSYLDRCIKEALRLYPSVSFILRITEEDVKLQSYLVPAGTTLFINIYGAHRDPNFWPNPEVFDPDRFLPEKIRHRHPYSYIPFSAGPRNCIGQRFAMLEMKAMIASLIHNFYLEPVDDLKNLRLQVGVTLCPITPLRIKFVPVCKINENI